MAWYMTIILLAFGEDTLASREDIRAPLDMGGLSIITIWSLKPLEFRGCCQLISALTKK